MDVTGMGTFRSSLVRSPTMDGWTWSDPRWRQRVGDDTAATVREALRRAIDLRDLRGGETRSGRPVLLVDVLNHLGDLLDVDTSSLWDLHLVAPSQGPYHAASGLLGAAFAGLAGGATVVPAGRPPHTNRPGDAHTGVVVVPGASG
jgi:hypothetical protein